MKTLEKLSHNNSVRPLMARLDFRFCAIYDPAGTGVAKRFSSTFYSFIFLFNSCFKIAKFHSLRTTVRLISRNTRHRQSDLKKKVVKIMGNHLLQEVDLDFLRRFASSEFSQKLFSGDGFTVNFDIYVSIFDLFCSKTSMTRPVAPSNRAVCAKEDSAKMLSSLENCFCSSVFVDLDWAVCVIFVSTKNFLKIFPRIIYLQDRLREKAMGNYKFYSERMLDSNDIGRALELDLEAGFFLILAFYPDFQASVQNYAEPNI